MSYIRHVCACGFRKCTLHTYTGSLFYLTHYVCHFLSLVRAVSGAGYVNSNEQEAANDPFQIK